MEKLLGRRPLLRTQPGVLWDPSHPSRAESSPSCGRDEHQPLLASHLGGHFRLGKAKAEAEKGFFHFHAAERDTELLLSSTEGHRRALPILNNPLGRRHSKAVASFSFLSASSLFLFLSLFFLFSQPVPKPKGVPGRKSSHFAESPSSQPSPTPTVIPKIKKKKQTE